MNKKIILSLIILICFKYCIAKVTIRKCCPLNYDLNEIGNGCQPSNITITTKWNLEANLTRYLPRDFQKSIPADDNDTSLNVACSPSKTHMLMWPDEFEISADGKVVSNTSKSTDFCLDVIRTSKFEVQVAVTCPCMSMTCLNVCCPEKQMMTRINGKARCVEAPPPWNDWTVDAILEVTSSDHKVMPWYGGKPECHRPNFTGPVVLRNEDLNINFTILANGTLRYRDEEDHYFVNPSQFCVSVFNLEGFSVDALVCYPAADMADEGAERVHAAVYCSLFVVGGVFLLATLLVHAALPELRRAVRGLGLMAHCACMLVAHVALIVVQLAGQHASDVPCHMLAYVIQYSLLAGFFWMNVMCIDIAATFRSLGSMIPHGMNQMRQFLWYSLYAMGLPFLMFIITFSANQSKVFPASAHPGIGGNSCWFKKKSLAILYYFYGPIGILLLFNFLLFAFTACRIIAFVRDTEVLNRQDSQRHDRKTDQKRFILFVKLFGLMGIPWVMEIVSWWVGGEDYYWYVTDAINLLRSVFIFVMFCCKRKVLAMLTTRYPWLRTKLSRIAPRVEQSDSSHTSRTNTANIENDSTAAYSMEFKA